MFRASRQAQRLRLRTSHAAAGAPRSTGTLSKAAVLLLQQPRSQSQTIPQRGPPPMLALQTARFASESESDHKKKVIKEALKPRPDEVSTTSSTRQVVEPSASAADPSSEDMGAGLKHDIGIVQDTFRLGKVPRESHILGLTGTVPYLFTSISTLFLSWDLSKELPTGNALYDFLFLDHDTARHLLGLIEPVQIGYGAVIISFLGAIHWGLEYAEKQPLQERTRFRYGVGVAAPIVAWPTIFMPLETALTTQFMAFVAMYFVDSRAATRGWAPAWYGNYRFLLTVMVGVAIFLSLVGRAKISQEGRLTKKGIRTSLHKEGIADTETDWVKVEAEEKERIKKEKQEAEKKAKKEAAAKKKAEKDSSAKDKKDDSKEGSGDEKKDGDSGEGDESKEGKAQDESQEGKGKDENEGKNKDESKE